MPVEIIEAADPLTAMVRFRTSTVYEMLVSLHTLQAARRHHDWVNAARLTLGADFVAELKALYGPCNDGSCLFEFPVDYQNHDDVPGFIRYVRDMDAVTFIFYFIGRTLSREQIAENGIDAEAIVAAVSNDFHHACLPASYLEWALTNLPAYQKRLTDLWERYWNAFFNQQLEMLSDYWTDAIAEKERILARGGGYGLLEFVTGKTELPRKLPVDQPVSEIVFVPLYYVSAKCYMFFGYGNETIMFDSSLSEERATVINENKERALEIAKALGDGTRLNILRLIAQQGHHMHGKRVASLLNLSATAVSRRIAQLRHTGLMAEAPHANLTVAYHLVYLAVSSLP